jgi:hypothetical protein
MMCCEWRRQEEQLQERLKGNKENVVPCRLKGAGRPSKITDDTAQQLMQYFDAEREKANKVDVPALLVQLRKVDPLVDMQIHNSNGSLAIHANIHKQIWRVLDKNNVATRRTTHQAQNTRYCQAMMDGYNAYLQQKMQMLMIGHDCVANFDETNVYFSPSTPTTLDRRGSRTVSVRSSKSSKRCTVMLGVTGDGKPFHPYIIFNGKYGPTGHIYQTFQHIYTAQVRMRDTPEYIPNVNIFGHYPHRCYYSVQEKAWMDSEHMLEWVKNVWKPWTNTKIVPQC